MGSAGSVAYVDMITVPGPDKILSKDAAPSEFIESGVMISVGKHASNTVAIAGHYDCAANPVSTEQHLADIRDSVERIRSWSLPIKVIGLWVNENWQVEVVVP